MAKKGGVSGAGILVVLIIVPFLFLFKFAQENPIPAGLLGLLLVSCLLLALSKDSGVNEKATKL